MQKSGMKHINHLKKNSVSSEIILPSEGGNKNFLRTRHLRKPLSEVLHKEMSDCTQQGIYTLQK